MQAAFQDPNWLKALTLTERAGLFKVEEGRAAPPLVDAAAAERRLNRWRSLASFDKDELFASRLAADGLSAEDLMTILRAPAGSLSRLLGAAPEWLSGLARAYSAGEGPAEVTASAIPSGQWGPGGGIMVGAAPLIQQGVDDLRDGIGRLLRRHGSLPFEPEAVVGKFLLQLPQALVNKAARTLVLELNVARLQGELRGATPEERFDHFNRRIAEPEFFINLLREYPVLARQLARTIGYWSRNSLEILERLCVDREEIARALNGGDDIGLLLEVAGDAGDAHREGRSVKILAFSSGFRLVYKPHSLSVDAHFAELLDWLNRRGDHPPFRTIAVLDRGEYGWAEFVPAGGCENEGEVKRFYRRQGGLLAVLYALEATDFHLENLIAAGEHPVLVDLEALFHPRVKAGRNDHKAFAPATQAMSYSVMRVGMLPQRVWSAADGEGVDLSGLGGTAGQLSPSPVVTFENRATDEMRVVRKRVEMGGSQNRPTVAGRDVQLQDHTEEIVAGFTSVYRLLLRERGALLGEGGPLARFAADEVRAVLRATKTYGELLVESYHPDVLRDALDRDRLFDHLWGIVGLLPCMAAVVPHEIEDLRRGDIPLFSARPNSPDLWTSRGARIPNFFEEPSLEVARRRINSLDEDDLARQAWFVRGSIASLTLGAEAQTFAGPKLVRTERVAGREELLRAGRAVGDRLEALAIRDENAVNWIGMTFVGGQRWTLMPLVDDIYNGTLGVALFLAYLGEVVGEERYTGLAGSVMSGIVRRVEQWVDADFTRLPKEAGAGGFSGVGSLIYALSHTGALWREPSHLDTAERLVRLVPRLVDADESLDIIGGSAGCIGNLLSLHRRTSSAAALEAARGCAERLLARAEPRERGLAWDTSISQDRPLTGYSHGAAGIASALLDLYGVTGDERYRRTALAAFEYERGVFSPERENWPDFRDPSQGGGGENFMTAWCHGAPGVGMSRLRALRHCEDPLVAAEIEAAVRTTIREGFFVSHCACHGDLGNLEFLHGAARATGDGGLLREVGQLAAATLDGIGRIGWLCGTPKNLETPGFMAGLAGIGYGLLRLAEPERVPSILTLEPPAAA